MTIYYDNALSAVIEAVIHAGGYSAIVSGDLGFLRDAAGVITAVIINDHASLDISALEASIAALEAYVDKTYPVARPAELLDTELADPAAYRRLTVLLNKQPPIDVLLINRRMVGSDWLSPVRDSVEPSVPIVAFCSLKGGVGRSTALSVAARHLSQAGLRVLAVDLDLEAPGLGSMLLPKENRPTFGTLDFYVERGPSAFSELDFAALIEASPYFEDGAPVYVAPAFGLNTFSSPENVLGKLSLAYLDDVAPDGAPISFLERTRKLISGLLAVRTFDVVLVDSRAGLHETAATSMLGIGADVLLFGSYQPQTFEGYLPLLAHVEKMIPNSSRLLPRLRMVHAKAEIGNAEEVESFRDAAHAMFSQTVYDLPEQTVDAFELGEATWFNVSDPDGPHYPWIIEENTRFRLFDPRSQKHQLDASVIGESFNDFLVNLSRNIEARMEVSGGAA